MVETPRSVRRAYPQATVAREAMESTKGLWELVVWRAGLTPDAPMIVDEHGERLTFADLERRAGQIAAWLSKRGVSEGAVVSWQLPNRIETVVLMAALSRLGAIQNPIPPHLREREVGFMVRQTGARHLVVPRFWRDFDYAAMAQSIQSEVPELDVIEIGDVAPRGERVDLPPFDTRSDAATAPVRWILYTSGTTSDPKGAMHTDAGCFVSAQNLSFGMDLGPCDRNTLVFPLAHIGGIAFIFADLLVGCCSIMVERFGPAAIQVLSREGVTLAGAGPAFFLEYLRVQRETPDEPIFGQLRAFVGGGSTRPPTLNRQLLETFGVGCVSGYGLTEAGTFTMTSMSDSLDVQASTEGRPYPKSEVRITDPEGRVLDAGGVGEIGVRGPQVMVGYVDPALDTAFDADRFFRTGDLGFLDADGRLHITGRIKDIIVRKGENISAREVEDLLVEYPGVAEVAVVGVADDDLGERCCAVLRMVDATTPTTAELFTYLTERGLANYKVPERVEFVTDLPRGASGKTNKAALRRMIESEVTG